MAIEYDKMKTSNPLRYLVSARRVFIVNELYHGLEDPVIEIDGRLYLSLNIKSELIRPFPHFTSGPCNDPTALTIYEVSMNDQQLVVKRHLGDGFAHREIPNYPQHHYVNSNDYRQIDWFEDIPKNKRWYKDMFFGIYRCKRKGYRYKD